MLSRASRVPSSGAAGLLIGSGEVTDDDVLMRDVGLLLTRPNIDAGATVAAATAGNRYVYARVINGASSSGTNPKNDLKPKQNPKLKLKHYLMIDCDIIIIIVY